jgi:cytochrome P450 family 142 subfamily A polypeptide 1
MRANEPVYRDRNGLWAITRHADVLDVERRARDFSSAGCYRSIVDRTEHNMIAQDDPGHAAQRQLVNRRFTPRAVRARTQEMQDIVDELVERAGEGEVEVVEAIAAQLPSRITARELGLDEDEWPLVKSWSERLMRTDARLSDQQVALDFFTACVELFHRTTAEVEARRARAGDDLFSVWASAQLDGEPMPEDSIFHEAGLFVSGGAETTRTLIAHGLRAFCDHNDQWELVASEPSLVPSAVEELLRWVTPLNNFFRTATCDTSIGGQEISAGDRVVLLYPSANRDEAVFDDPFRFDVTRDPNPQIAFGNGTHFCLGANLARHSLTILFTTLTQRWTNLRVVAEPDVEANIFARGVRSFRLGVDRRG